MSERLVSDDLREQTIKLFGTDNLDDIFPEVPQRAEISTVVPSFDAVLLSLGINPNDIEGEMVQPPPQLKQAFDNLRTGLENDVAYGEFKNFEDDPPAALDPVLPPSESTKSSGGYPKENCTVARPDSLKTGPKSDVPLDQLFPDFSKKPDNVWDALTQKMISEYHDADNLSSDDKERRLRPISLPVYHPSEGKIQLVEDPTGCVAVMSTGAVLWPAAAAMIDWMGKELPVKSDTPLRALELGAGLGSVGLFFQMFMGYDVVLTDVDEATELLRKNVHANFKDGVGGPIIESLRWNHAEHIKQVRTHAPDGFDVIVGTDITYREDLLDALLSTMRTCIRPGGRVFLTMQDRTNEARNFQHACIRGGWKVVSKNLVPPPAIMELKKSSVAEGQAKWDLVPPHIEQIWLFEIALRDSNAKPEKDHIPVPPDETRREKEEKARSLVAEQRMAEIVKGFLFRGMGEMLCEQDDRLAKFISSMKYPPVTEEDKKQLAAAFFDEDGRERTAPPDLSFDDKASLLRRRCEQQLTGGMPEMEDEESRKSPKADNKPRAGDEKRKSPKAGSPKAGTLFADHPLMTTASQEAIDDLAEAKLCADGVEWNIERLDSMLKVTVTFTYEAWMKLGSGDSAFRDLIDFEIAEDALRVKHTDTIVFDLKMLQSVDPERATAKLSGKSRRVVVTAPLLEK